MPNQLLYQIRRALFEPVSGFRSYCKGPGLQSAFRKLRVHDATLFADGLRSFDAPPAKDVTPAPKDIPRGEKLCTGRDILCRTSAKGCRTPGKRCRTRAKRYPPGGKALHGSRHLLPHLCEKMPHLGQPLAHSRQYCCTPRAHDRYARVGTGRLYRLGGLRYLRDER